MPRFKLLYRIFLPAVFFNYVFLFYFCYINKLSKNELKIFEKQRTMEIIEPLERENTKLSDIVDEVWTKPKAVSDLAKLWKYKREKRIKDLYLERINQKRKRDFASEKEINQLVARKIPFEYLAQDWFEEKKVFFKCSLRPGAFVIGIPSQCQHTTSSLTLECAVTKIPKREVRVSKTIVLFKRVIFSKIFIIKDMVLKRGVLVKIVANLALYLISLSL